MTAKLYHGDCLDILSTLGTECPYCGGSGVDTQGFTAQEFLFCEHCDGKGRSSLVIVTDPPYGLGFPYNSYSDTRENLVALIGNVMPKLLSMADRTCILPGITQVHLYPEPTWIMCITWNTTGSFGAYGYTQWMPLLVYGKDLDGFGNVNGVTKTDTFRINGGSGVGFQRNGSEGEHPCPKPENVMRLIITRLTLPGATVLDPFMGSGTTGVACVRTGRNFIGIEKDEAYFKIAQRRIADAEQQPHLFTEEPIIATQQELEI